MQSLGIECDLGPAGAATEEVDGTALANHLRRPLPGFRTSHGLDHYIRPTTIGGQSTQRLHRITDGRDLNHVVATRFLCRIHLAVAFHYADHVATDKLCYLHEHQSDGAAADDGDCVTDLDLRLMESAQYASQRLDQRSLFVRDVRRDRQHVQVNDALWNLDVLGVRAVVEEQIFAKIF